MPSFESLQQLVPAVAIAVILMGGFSYIITRFMAFHRDEVDRVQAREAEAHKEKNQVYMDEARRKDENMMRMVSDVFAKNTIAFEKTSQVLDKFTVLFEQWLREKK